MSIHNVYNFNEMSLHGFLMGKFIQKHDQNFQFPVLIAKNK